MGSGGPDQKLLYLLEAVLACGSARGASSSKPTNFLVYGLPTICQRFQENRNSAHNRGISIGRLATGVQSPLRHSKSIPRICVEQCSNCCHDM